MRYSTALSNLQRLKKLRNRIFLLTLLSLLLNVLLLLGLLWTSYNSANQQRTVLVPPMIEDRFWVSQKNYSASYLAQMSVFFAQLRFNATASSGPAQNDLLLSYVHPKAYEIFKKQLADEQAARRTAQMSSVFYPVSVDVDLKQQSARLIGDLWQIVDGEVLPVHRRHYQIQTRYEQGRLFIRSFQELGDED